MHYPLHQAVLKDDKDEVERLLKDGVSPSNLDDYGNTALHWSVFGGNYDIAELLLRNGADVNAIANDGVSPLWRAEDFGLTRIADLVRSFGGKFICQTRRQPLIEQSRLLQRGICLPFRHNKKHR